MQVEAGNVTQMQVMANRLENYNKSFPTPSVLPFEQYDIYGDQDRLDAGAVRGYDVQLQEHLEL